MKKQPIYSSVEIRKITLSALLFAVSLVLSIIESSIPAITNTVPGVKLGLSNIPIMYALFFIGKGHALTITTLKSIFVAGTRGLVAGFLSFCGGWLSVIVMVVLLFIFKKRISYMLISIFGAVSHNIGQFTAISLIYSNLNLWVYLPVLILSGTAAGVATATLLKFILPALHKLNIK